MCLELCGCRQQTGPWIADDHEHKDEDLGKEFFHSGTNHVKDFAIGNPHFVNKAWLMS